jgi:hypothetical protein
MSFTPSRNWLDIPPMIDVVKPGQIGEARISYVKVDTSEPDIFFANLRYTRDGASFMRLRDGTYARLHVDGELMMSDTVMERHTNLLFLQKARGDVLVAGLGIGMVLTPLLSPDRPEGRSVRSVTVLEKSADVIALVGPYFQDPRLTIVHADVEDWTPAVGQTFNTIWLDVWPTLDSDNLPMMARLKRKYRKYLDRSDPDAWIGAWSETEVRALKRRGRRI